MVSTGGFEPLYIRRFNVNVLSRTRLCSLMFSPISFPPLKQNARSSAESVYLSLPINVLQTSPGYPRARSIPPFHRPRGDRGETPNRDSSSVQALYPYRKIFLRSQREDRMTEIEMNVQHFRYQQGWSSRQAPWACRAQPWRSALERW